MLRIKIDRMKNVNEHQRTRKITLYARRAVHNAHNIQSWARDNTAATTWPSFQCIFYFVFALCIYSLWLLHVDTEALTFSFFFLLTTVLTLSRCRCREAKNLSRAQLWINICVKQGLLYFECLSITNKWPTANSEALDQMINNCKTLGVNNGENVSH